MAYYYEVAPNSIVRHDSEHFTYSCDQKMSVGQIIRVPVGRRTLVGVILSQVSKPSYNTKPIIDMLYETPLPPHLINTLIWLGKYYSAHLATVLQLALPSGITKKRRPSRAYTTVATRRTKNLLNADQRGAVEQINAITGTVLLRGITGSGKTRIYIELARQTLANDQSSIVLVPEISLTPQLVQNFTTYFPGQVIVTHSQQTEAERQREWANVLNSTKPQIIIGPRSALFMPVKQLGLIVIDEAHEPSYKQDKTPRYSAIRVASTLAKQARAKLILGSATPLITDFYIAEKHHSVVSLDTLATPNAKQAIVEVIDCKDRQHFKRHRFLSDELLSAIEHPGQTLIFHNRRGSTTTTLCQKCGWMALDPETGIPLTLHVDDNVLFSHITGKSYPVPVSCPVCGSPDIIHKGIGTKLIESELKKIFPDKKIARFDGDNRKADSLAQNYEAVRNGDIDVVIGTQIIAKGLDLPHLYCVGTIQADTGLFLPDYGSSERTFQLISQVVGRVGRNANNTIAIIQTYKPDEPAIRYGVTQNYSAFYLDTLKQRHQQFFPPFCYILRITCIYKTEKLAVSNSRAMLVKLKQAAASDTVFLGPTPAFYEYINSSYHWQITVKARKRQSLVDLAHLIEPTPHWQVELDSYGLLG